MRPARALLYGGCCSAAARCPRGRRAAAIFECGTFDGKFQCRATQGGVVHGKGAIPGVDRPEPHRARTHRRATAVGAASPNPMESSTPGEHSCPPGYRVLAAPQCVRQLLASRREASDAAEHGLRARHGRHAAQLPVAPKIQSCWAAIACTTPPRCSNGLSADALPQACRKVDEKLACKMRQDGLKDCCCLLYDKL